MGLRFTCWALMTAVPSRACDEGDGFFGPCSAPICFESDPLTCEGTDITIPPLRRADHLQTSDVDKAAPVLGRGPGRPVDPEHPGSRGNYPMLEHRPMNPLCRSSAWTTRVVSTSTSRPTTSPPKWRAWELGAEVVNRLQRWVVMQAPTGQRFCVVPVQRPGFPKNANRWG